jgi:hypothetical protein
MYTFKELDYKSVWINLTVVCKKIKQNNKMIVNDSNEYIASESVSESISSVNKNEESKMDNTSIKIKKKSSKYFNERLSAKPSKAQNDSEALASSIVDNSVYMDNQSEYGPNEYS